MGKCLLHFLALSLFVSKFAYSDPIGIVSCSQTPYPHVCTSLIGTTSRLSKFKTPSTFFSLALRATLDQALLTHELVSSTDPSSLDERAKAAWADCFELSEHTVHQLNRTMIAPSSHEDEQTWLSAAIANQLTCLNGFTELNSSSLRSSLPFMYNTVSKSISNSLAITKSMAPVAHSPRGSRRLLSEGFPRWLSAADRKLLHSSAKNADLVVAEDAGSGNYKTINEALAASTKRRTNTSRYVIHVKAGVYNEYIEITSSMKNLMIVGDGIDVTVITGGRNVQDGYTTFKSATFAVVGDGFIAQDVTFQNAAGPSKNQAVALRSGSDLSVFYRCSFKGYQDTLYVHSQRQFYRECDIYGTVDFIFGDAVAVLQSCNIYVRKPMTSQKNTVTAQGRKDPNENTGISIHGSVITAASDLKPVQGSIQSYLGRPWQKYSRTVVMKTRIDGLIDPKGWLEWSGSFALSTLYYGEYMNTGPGAGTGMRVMWPGYRVITSSSEAGKFTVGNFLGGGSWLPATGVPNKLGL